MRRVTDADPIALDEIRLLAEARFGDMIKGVVDPVVVDFLAGTNEYGSTGPSLQKYFDQFALAARRAHLSGKGSNNSASR